MSASVAYADQYDVIRPYINLTEMYDDNIRRLQNEQQALALTGTTKMSDFLTIGKAGVIVDKDISQQNIFVNANVSKSIYSTFSALNSDSNEITARWKWHLNDHLDGVLEQYRLATAVPFNDYRGQNSTLYTQDTTTFDAKWKFHPSWQIHSELQRYQINYDALLFSAANRTEDAEEVGIDYLPKTDSSVGVQYRHVRGDLPTLQNVGIFLFQNSYDQNEFKANVNYVFSAKTNMQFLGGIVDRKYDEISARDFTGFNARGTVQWVPTGKTLLSLTGWREIGALTDVTATYTLNRGISANASWYTTSKITLQGNVSYETRDFVGDAFISTIQRNDSYRNASLGIVYKPITPLEFNASLIRSIRSSTVSAYDFTSNSIVFTAQYNF